MAQLNSLGTRPSHLFRTARHLHQQQAINYPPGHYWYEAKHPSGSLSLQCSKQGQTIVTRFRSERPLPNFDF
ncbi:hypothetical protein TNCV_2257931 [Trichonephila clavipes]|nr:hypothetical protein TNCV_2257931 [Trichonephila clavipes]